MSYTGSVDSQGGQVRTQLILHGRETAAGSLGPRERSLVDRYRPDDSVDSVGSPYQAAGAQMRRGAEARAHSTESYSEDSN
jgi:hypothetical protein